jgi:hypothetical protein
LVERLPRWLASFHGHTLLVTTNSAIPLQALRAITRFEAERQALALMDHPNIASVRDAGTTPSGFPMDPGKCSSWRNPGVFARRKSGPSRVIQAIGCSLAPVAQAVIDL